MKTSLNKKTPLLIAILATIVALGVHLYLTQHYYGVKYGTATESAVCNINEVFNCDAVSASKFSSLFGIPLALWGLATNLILLYFLLVTRFNLVADQDKTSRYSFLLSSLTVGASLVMGAISMTMDNLCLFCITAYVLSIIGWIGIYFAQDKGFIKDLGSDIKDVFTSQRWVLGFLIAIPVVAFTANLMYMESQGFTEIEKRSQEIVAYWSASPTRTFDPKEGLIYQNGDSEPVMTIVEFADFRCPHCKHAATPLHAFTKSHSDVRLIFKPFPLDGTCNDAMGGGGDGISCGLAAAVVCAESMGQKGWQAHDHIFDRQMEVIRAQNLQQNLKEVAEFTTLDEAALKECVKSTETLEKVRKMANEGKEAQIQGTPTVFVNGKLLRNGQMVPVLEAVYKHIKGK